MKAQETLSDKSVNLKFNSTTIKVILVFLSGLVVNKLSDLVDLSAPIVLISAFIVLLAMLAVEQTSPGRVKEHAEGFQLIRFCLVSLIIGAAIAGLWILPIFPSKIFDGIHAYGIYGTFSGYELGAACVVALLAAIAAIRKQRITQVSSFLVSSITGMTMVVQAKSGNEETFVITFFAWLGASSALMGIIYLLPDFAKLFFDFLGFRLRRSSNRDKVNNSPDAGNTPAEGHGTNPVQATPANDDQ
jgi:hypothetical protein